MKILDHLEEWLIAFLMGAATLLIFVAVVHRYGTGVDFLYSIPTTIVEAARTSKEACSIRMFDQGVLS